MALPLSRIDRQPHLSEAVAEALRGRIEAGEFAPGAQLPVEKVLAESFAVSRAVVREAVARLKADGLVETRQGAGAFVAARPHAQPFRLVAKAKRDPEDLRQIFELRMMLEMAVAELAAQRRKMADIAAMRSALEAMDAALAADSDGSDADDAFHGAMAAATHNRYVTRLVESLCGHFSDSRKLSWDAQARQLANARAAQAEHQRLFAAVEAGDGARARRMSRQHLVESAKRAGLKLAEDLAKGGGRKKTD
jgi:GntR family transcriptional repressor for pyruvate dehydrogenase complex